MASSSGPVASDLVVVALGGVQRYIGESRTTADLAAGSEIVAELACAVAEECERGAELVFPQRPRISGGLPGTPNRIVSLAPGGTGAEVAKAAAEAARDAWSGLVRKTYHPDPVPPDDFAAGIPDVTWVSVPASAGDYERQWGLAQRALAARRVVRDFAAMYVSGETVCSLSPRWPAAEPPRHARRHHRSERLAVANWVKRQRRLRDVDDFAGYTDAGERYIGFPSTYSISSARFREAVVSRMDDERVVERVQALRLAAEAVRRTREVPVPGLSGHRHGLPGWVAQSAGPWVYPDGWRAARLKEEFGEGQPGANFSGLAAAGKEAAQELIKVMELGEPTDYLAMVVQDLDGMGAFLSAEGPARDGRRLAVSAVEHQGVSDRLQKLGEDQVDVLRNKEVLGVPVYVGGDDLLAFAPAATALMAAEKVHGLVPPELPTASTAVLFFHHTTSLRRVVETVQTMVKEVKDRMQGKHGLAVGFLRRSGARAESIQPWSPAGSGTSVIDLFAMLGRGDDYRLSPGLVADLERDRDELAVLRYDYPRHHAAEIQRLVDRHTSGQRSPERGVRVRQAATALVDLADREWAVDDRGEAAHILAPAQVGVFLRQEAR